jgi:type II secretory pathway component GspD/PulD (secretin)
MKRSLTLLWFAAMLALTPALAQPSPLPADERYSQPVSFSTGSSGESLRAMVTALARSIGLTPVVDGVPETIIVYDIGDAKPFRQVWDLVLSLNDLVYVLQENDVVVVGTAESLARLRGATAGADAGSIQRFYRVNGSVEQIATIVRRAVRGVSVESLPGTDALVVIGTEEQQAAVVETLAEFDRPADVIPLEQRTYFLSNAAAAELAATLQATTIIGADDRELRGTFTVVPEPRTNSIIVTGTLDAQRRLGQLIQALDAPQRQVNIQVRIQEISRRTAFDLGIDWTNVGFGNLATNILSGGLNFIFDTTNVISSLNVRAVLDTLESQGLTRRVDDTTITVLDNGKGTIQAGGTIFITLPGASENIERTIPYGVQVDVTPRIAADGRITLVVDARVEDVISTTNDPTFLNLSTRSVNSTVTVHPGQTILLGGLLQNSLSVSQRRIPILGSLPLIGGLFGRTVTEEDSVDLLVVITAQIID